MGVVTITFDLACKRRPVNAAISIDAPGRLVTVARVIALAATVFEVSTLDIRGPFRGEPFVVARHAAIWTVRRTMAVSLPVLGRALDRDHSTILSALRSADRRRARDPDFRRLTDALVEAVTKLQSLEEQPE